MSFDSVESIT